MEKHSFGTNETLGTQVTENPENGWQQTCFLCLRGNVRTSRVPSPFEGEETKNTKC